MPETIRSIVSQDIEKPEVVVIDDGSTDRTSDIVTQLLGAAQCLRIAHSGRPSVPRNHGIRHTKSDYIALFDSDDIMMPEKLSKQLAFYEENPDLGMVFTDFCRFSGDRDSIGAPVLRSYKAFQACPKMEVAPGRYRIAAGTAYEVLLQENFVGTSSVMIRRTVLDNIGLFDESLKNSDDRDLWFRIAKSYDIGFMSIVGHLYRVRAGSVSTATIGAYENRMRVFKRQLLSDDLTPQMRSHIRRRLGEYFFDMGYLYRLQGDRLRATKTYIQSVAYNPSLRGIIGVVKSILPATQGKERDGDIPR